MTIPRQLIFTGRSIRWGGGVCAVIPVDDTESRCLGRAWLITVGQLLDVWQQENGGLAPDQMPWDDLERFGFADLPSGRYRRLDRLDPIGGVSAVTITCGPEMVAEVRSPSDAYLAMVADGVQETLGCSEQAARSYLAEPVLASDQIGAAMSPGDRDKPDETQL